MPRLTLSLLGSFAMTLDDKPLKRLRSRKIQALLAYLVTEEALQPGVVQPREGLMTLLWPDITLQSAQTNLRQALSQLRKAIPEVAGRESAAPVPFIVADRQSVHINPAARYDLDLVRFLQLTNKIAMTAALAEAVELYKEEFLKDLFIPDSAAFEDWANRRRAALRQQQLSALNALTEQWLLAGDYEEAKAYARRQLALDDLREPAYGQLMTALAGLGRRAEALRVYEQCCERLLVELAVEPGPELGKLVEQLQKGRLPAGPDQQGLISIEVPTTLPEFLALDAPEEQGKQPIFVAREEELARMDEFLQAASAGQGMVVFVKGSAGRGKTALLDAFARQAQADYAELLVASGSCNAFAGLGDPYLPFREILSMLTGDVESQWKAGRISREQARRLWEAVPRVAASLLDHGPNIVTNFVPALALLKRIWLSVTEKPPWLNRLQEYVEATVGQLAEEQDSTLLFQQYANVLAAVAVEHPLLLFLDDMQWADDASLSLLFHLGRRLQGRRILIVCAYRTAEVAAGRDGAPHPLAKIESEFRRLSGEVVIDLGVRGAEWERHFVDAYLAQEPHRLDETFHRALADHTKGHPLFTVELLRALQERGELVQDDEGRWVAAPALDWMVLPDRVEAVIEERVGRLDEDEREILTLASVEGERFTAQVVAQAYGIRPRKLINILSRDLGKRHRLVKSDGVATNGGLPLAHYRFAHGLFQHYLYNNLSEGERQSLHHEVGIALESHAGSIQDGGAAQLARHFAAAGDRELACHYHLQAGGEALGTWAWAEAEQHLRRGLSLEPTDRQLAELLYGLGKACLQLSRADEAELHLALAGEIYLKLGRPYFEHLARVYAKRVQAAYVSQGIESALAICNEGLDALAEAPDSPGLCRLLHERARKLNLSGSKFESLEVAREALALAKRVGDVEYQVLTMTLRTDLPGQSDSERVAILREALALAQSIIPNRRPPVEAYVFQTLGTTVKNPRERLSYCQLAVNRWRKTGALPFTDSGNLLLAHVQLGDFSSAQRVLEDMQDMLSSGVGPNWRAAALTRLCGAILLSRRGEWEQSIREFQEVCLELEQRGDLDSLDIANIELAYSLIERNSCAYSSSPAELLKAETLLQIQDVESAPRHSYYLRRFYLAQLYVLIDCVEQAGEQFELGRDMAMQDPSDKKMAELNLTKAHIALAGCDWDGALTHLANAASLFKDLGNKWLLARLGLEWAQAFQGRNLPGDREHARQMLAQSLDMFTEMVAPGYEIIVKQRLAALNEGPDK